MAEIWGTSSKKNLKILERNIRGTARLLLKRRKYDKVKFDMYDKLNWFLPYDSYLYKSLCLIYQILNHASAPYFNGINVYISNITRNKFGRYSFMFKACTEWNLLPQIITESKSLNCFKSNLKQHIVELGKTLCTT